MTSIDICQMRRLVHRPVDFARHIIGVKPDENQCAILDGVAKNQMTSVRSGHGVGKSAVESWLILWFLCTRPYPKIPCTSPTDHQLKDILWAEIAKWIRHSQALNNIIVWTQERVYLKGHAKEWFAVARTATKPDALQGFHAEHILYIIDEASGVDDDRFEPVLGSLSTPGAKLLMCGNPTKLSGFFFDSHHKNRDTYSTFHIDGRTSKRVDSEFVSKIANMYGEDSDVFRVRVAGEFPLAEDDVYIPLPLIERSVTLGLDRKAYVDVRRESEADLPGLIHIGCDVARFGDDKTVIGYKIDEKVKLAEKRRGQDTMKTADKIVELGERLIARYKWRGKIPVKIYCKRS